MDKIKMRAKILFGLLLAGKIDETELHALINAAVIAQKLIGDLGNDCTPVDFAATKCCNLFLSE